MSFVNHFYNATTRKYVALFGTLFNKIQITRNDLNEDEEQRMVVPIAYGPWQKFLSRITQDPNFTQGSAITLPRLSFEITNIYYDGSRKIGSLQKLRKADKTETDNGRYFLWSPAPYNLDFSLYIMTKYSEDAMKIVEQILPFFKPEWTPAVKIMDDIEALDVPIILTGITSEDLYEGDYITRRSVLWTLNFTMRGWYFGPERKKKVIKFVDAHMFTRVDNDAVVEEKVQVQPGLTSDGKPTTNIDETIPYQNIEFEDDWDIIKVIITDIDQE